MHVNNAFQLLIENANEYIGKTVFELASKTKETNEKLKKMVNK